jgi:hypothetical protein
LVQYRAYCTPRLFLQSRQRLASQPVFEQKPDLWLICDIGRLATF